MEDWSADSSGDLGAVCARTGTIRSRGEANLVIDDDMDGAADFIVPQPLHLEALVHDTLASDRSITVHNNGHYSFSVLTLATKEVLFGTGSALYAWVHGFEVRWVGHKSEFDLVARISVRAAIGGSKMILDVTSTCINRLLTLIRLDSLELCHDDLHGLAHHISQGVESAPVRHSNDKSAGSLIYSRINAEFEARDE